MQTEKIYLKYMKPKAFQGEKKNGSRIQERKAGSPKTELFMY